MTEEDMHRLLSDWQAWETLTEQLGLGRWVTWHTPGTGWLDGEGCQTARLLPGGGAGWPVCLGLLLAWPGQRARMPLSAAALGLGALPPFPQTPAPSPPPYPKPRPVRERT